MFVLSKLLPFAEPTESERVSLSKTQMTQEANQSLPVRWRLKKKACLLMFPVWEVTTATASSPCQIGDSGRHRERRWSSHSRGWLHGVWRTHGHGQYFCPCMIYFWHLLIFCVIWHCCPSFFPVTFPFSAATRRGGIQAASLVLWLCQKFCWEDSSGALLPLL